MTQTIDQRARELLAKHKEAAGFVRTAADLRAGNLDAWDKPFVTALTEALARIEELERALQTWPCAYCGGKGTYLAKGIRPTGERRKIGGEVESCKFCEGTCIDPRARAALTQGITE